MNAVSGLLRLRRSLILRVLLILLILLILLWGRRVRIWVVRIENVGISAVHHWQRHAEKRRVFRGLAAHHVLHLPAKLLVVVFVVDVVRIFPRAVYTAHYHRVNEYHHADERYQPYAAVFVCAHSRREVVVNAVYQHREYVREPLGTGVRANVIIPAVFRYAEIVAHEYARNGVERYRKHRAQQSYRELTACLRYVKYVLKRSKAERRSRAVDYSVVGVVETAVVENYPFECKKLAGFLHYADYRDVKDKLIYQV
mgnify:FL=1